MKCPELEPGLAACQANVLPLSSLQLLTVNSVGLGIVLYPCSQKGKEIVSLCLYVFFLSLSLCLYWNVRSTSEGFHKLGEVGRRQLNFCFPELPNLHAALQRIVWAPGSWKIDLYRILWEDAHRAGPPAVRAGCRPLLVY